MKVKVQLRNVGVDFLVHSGAVKTTEETLSKGESGSTGANFRKVGGRYVASALDDVSLKLEPGDRVGLIGHNGSGKTTLLRVLSGTLEPTRGAVTIVGRIASLMSTTFGFAPAQTGRENIYRRALMMCVSRQEIEQHVEDIIEFAELGAYIDMPMSTYSAGMRTRLGFAITTSINADIILMDEWIGAGDARFAERAQSRLKETLERSSILVLASHKAGLLKKTCNKIGVMEKGKLIALGGLDVLDEYEDYLTRRPRSAKAMSEFEDHFDTVD